MSIHPAEFVISRWIYEQERLLKTKTVWTIGSTDGNLVRGTTDNKTSICSFIRNAVIHFPTEEELEIERKRLLDIRKKKEATLKWQIKLNKKKTALKKKKFPELILAPNEFKKDEQSTVRTLQ